MSSNYSFESFSYEEVVEEETVISEETAQVNIEEDSIHSGESKFKTYTFEANEGRSPNEIQQCIDFWKFIESHKDLYPKHGFKVTAPTDCKAKQKGRHTEELTWTEVLKLLKSKNLDKVANLPTDPKELCKIETCYEQSQRKKIKSPSQQRKSRLDTIKSEDDEDDDVDDFQLDVLNDYEPYKVTYAEVECQTDPIETTENEAQTDETASVLDLRERFKGLDDLLKEVAGADLTGYFDCICDPPCEWLPYPTSTSSPQPVRKSKRRKKDICTCSCGEANCLCSICAEILKSIQNARDSFEQLSEYEIEQCPCVELSCACLEDYRTLLDVKLEINQAVREAANDPEAKFGLPVKCKCSCEQNNCPCKIVMQLFSELDELMGYKEKPLFYYDEELERTIGVDVCRCDGENDDEQCACLSFFRQRIKDKIGINTNHSQQNLRGKSPANAEPDQDCLCEDRDCLMTASVSDASILTEIKSYSDILFPAVPPNSTTSQLQ